MPDVVMTLKDGRTLTVPCDRYEVEKVTEGEGVFERLRFYAGGRKISDYDMSEVVGYHELPPRGSSPPPKPWMQ